MSDGVKCKGSDKQRGTWSDFGQEALVVASAGLSADPALTHPLRPLSGWLLCFPRPSLLFCPEEEFQDSRIEEILEAVPPNVLSDGQGLDFPAAACARRTGRLLFLEAPLFCWGTVLGTCGY